MRGHIEFIKKFSLSFVRATANAQSALDGALAIVRAIERGQGTIGGFLVDKEVFDDLHDTHRIIKSQPWSLIMKSGKRRPVEMPKALKPR